MEPQLIGAIGVVLFVLLVLLGTWIGFAAATIGLAGIVILKGWDAMGGIAGYLPYGATASFEFSAIPLFIILGYLAAYGGITDQIFRVCRAWIGHFGGGLALATTAGSAIFGAISGSSTAATVVIGQISIPEMLKHGYDPKLASGTVAAGGTLDAMIPPSLVMIIYGVIAEQSIAGIMMAGIVPGLFEAALFAIVVYVWCRRNPRAGPALPVASWRERFASLKDIWAALLLAGGVLGGMYGGIFTPTEAGGAGAFGALLLGLLARKLTWANFKKTMLDTAKTTSMIFLAIVGILILLRFLAFSGITRATINFMLGLNMPSLGIIIGIILVYAILGMFVTATGMMMLTVPFFLPVITALGYNPIWFGIIVVKMCEVGFLTPPVAMNIFAVKAVAPEIPTADIIKGVLPFLVMDFISLAFFIAFPNIIMWLPQTMRHA